MNDAATMAEGVARLLAAARAGHGAMAAAERQRAQMLMVNVQVGCRLKSKSMS